MDSNISNIASDSLYKFLAILGVALFISPTFLDRDVQSVHLETIDMEKSIAQREREISSINREIDAIGQKESDIEANAAKRDSLVNDAYRRAFQRLLDIKIELMSIQKDLPHANRDRLLALLAEVETIRTTTGVPGPTYEDMAAELDGVTAQLDDVAKKLGVEEGLYQDNQFELQKLQVKLDYLQGAVALMLLSRTAGAVMTVLGFALWYFRLQRHLDFGIRHQAGPRRPIRRAGSSYRFRRPR